MKKKNFQILLTIFLIFSSRISKAITFYSGIGGGDSKTKINNYTLDEKRAFTFSLGSSFDIPLFPIRLEAEYLKFNSKETNIDTITYGGAINTYVNLPLLPILVPYIGFGIAHLTEKIETEDIIKKSDKKFTPQYILGLDLNLPTFILAGSIEYRYIKTHFDFQDDTNTSKYYVLLFKTRLKF